MIGFGERSAAARCAAVGERGIALIAVLMAMTLLLLLALPFAVSMSRGADVAVHEVEVRQAELASQSVRELLLADASFGHPTYDETPSFDSLLEFPDRLSESFAGITQDGRVRLGGECHDLQRYFALDAITPLMLSNLMGTTARLAEPLEPDASLIALRGGENLPDSGYVLVDWELIRYGARDGNTLTSLDRYLHPERGFVREPGREDDPRTVIEGAIVFDWRTVLASMWSFDGRTGFTRRERQPLAHPGELAEIEKAGFGGFSQHDMDAIQSAVAGSADVTWAPTWGRPERVFNDVRAPDSSRGFLGNRTLVVKSALHLGAGSTVRIRNLSTGAFEYGMVLGTSTPRSTPELLLPSIFHLHLVYPVTQDFPATDSVVEPLVPPPVNINTAPLEVIQSLVQGCRRGSDVRVHDSSTQVRVRPDQPINRTEAQKFAEDIVTMRDENNFGPFAGFQELVARVFATRFAESSGQSQIMRWVYLYRLLLTGRDSALEMGTAPICFRSGPMVGYRAAATVQRSSAAAGIAARSERTGIAAALPGVRLVQPWQTQEQIEEAFRFDRRAPYWLTTPINTGAIARNPGNDPTSRYLAHVIPTAFPGLDFGSSRFPSRDETDAAIVSAPASAPQPRQPDGWRGGLIRGHESFSTAMDPRGHDIAREGPFRIENTGPDGSGSSSGTRGGAHKITHPFTDRTGGAGRFAVDFWVEPDALGESVLLDYSDGDPERNRMAMMVRDGQLVFEVIDEAGLDPDPGQSPAGVQRTASEWMLPLADLALPPRTPVHLAATAYGSRPTDLVVSVDGMQRGQRKYRTYLTDALPMLSQSELATPQPVPPPGSAVPSREQRSLRISVDSTDGFPPQGVLRIGRELFEYTLVEPGAFLCELMDSAGGRTVRQGWRELPPDQAEVQPQLPGLDPEQRPEGQYPPHPRGAEVELYGYSALPAQDSLLHIGETAIDGSLGAFSVARAFTDNPRGIDLPLNVGQSIPIGLGLDENWTGDLELADPIPTGTEPPELGEELLAEGFPAAGGYALLVQRRISFSPGGGAIGTDVLVGGVEVIRYASREGSVLSGVERAQQLPGENAGVDPGVYDGTARKFVSDWSDGLTVDNGQVMFDELPTMILWVVPISIPLQGVSDLPDPAVTSQSEWVQLLPNGGDTSWTEWVRYDAIVDNRHLVRGNRGAWGNVYRQLTNARRSTQIGLGPLGPEGGVDLGPTDPPWATFESSSSQDFIGCITKLESDWPQIYFARRDLHFRGDTATATTSHPQANSKVLPVHRVGLSHGRNSALTARPGRHDRVALIQGSASSGTSRPNVEWHTVNWSRRFPNVNSGINPETGQPNPAAERINIVPMQLVAFQDAVRSVALVGPTLEAVEGPNGQDVDVRTRDRIVKFPSGELPAAYCDAVTVGGAVSGEQMSGYVDEISTTNQIAESVVLLQEMSDSDQGFTVDQHGALRPGGLLYFANDLTQSFPEQGGLLQIDDEVLAYQGYSTTTLDGVEATTFVIAQNGRGLLGSEPRGHDRGARVHFLTHRPAAILTAGVQPRSNSLSVQSLGAMPQRYGTALLGRTELLHYTWARKQGDRASFEMPRSWEGGSSGGSGLFRGRFGTIAASASSGEPLIWMPFRYWDRHVEGNDDPEQSYFQFTTREAPVFFRTLSWSEETMDSSVDVVCCVRADGIASWSDDPETTPDFWRLERSPGASEPFILGVHATQLEVRFATVYMSGCVDLVGFQAHAWKTAVRVDEVELEYEGEGRVLAERVTAR